jgi:hypothetical protein
MENYIKEQLEDITAQLVDGRGALAVQITHVSQSGMSYRYSVHFVGVNDKGQAACTPITWLFAKITGEKLNDKHEIRGNGIGFDRRLHALIRFTNALGESGILDTQEHPLFQYTARLINL